MPFDAKYAAEGKMEERLLSLLRLALRYNATDIHFSMFYQEVKIEMRIDGKFFRVKEKFEDYRLMRYLQYLANLDIGNLTIPQTGQFEMDVDGNDMSLRFAVINSGNSTNGVLRILNSNLKVTADKLSNLEGQNRYFRSLLTKRCGLVLFSGPTGSGKTTTLYALLKACRNKKIYSIEDPIEVYNDGIIQLQINEKMGFDYKTGVEQILRHDPDIIMIGEIREEKAAQIAVVAANTGHLVLSTIHSSKASSVISRMCELGVNESHLYENLICIVNQRLMTNVRDRKKIVLYEVMDAKEIGYFRKNGHNSKDFLDIDTQIERGIDEGIFEREVL